MTAPEKECEKENEIQDRRRNFSPWDAAARFLTRTGESRKTA